MNSSILIRPRVAVVIPCYRCLQQVVGVIQSIGPEVSQIYVIDDQCPEKTGEHVQRNVTDARVRVLFHKQNLGVGGALLTGYSAALEDMMEIVVKIDGDGQMNPALIPKFIRPIVERRADYVKGNRFYNIEDVRQMPMIRLLGNAVLSFMSKLSSGYWNLFDPTNGFTAIHREVLSELPFGKIHRRYFFESDMLFRLGLARAVVLDIPMTSSYGDESSSLRILQIIPEFLISHARNTCKRIFYSYFLRSFSLASLELVIGILLVCFGAIYGSVSWSESIHLGRVTPGGTVMLAALPILVGIQLLLGFLNLDMSSVPASPRCLNWQLEGDSASRQITLK